LEKQEKIPCGKRDLSEKESRYWTELQFRFETMLRQQGAATRPWYQMDREGDAKHVLLRGLSPTDLFTVRAHENRLLTAQSSRRAHLKLYEAVHSGPAAGIMYLDLPASAKRTPRVARLVVRIVHVGIKLRTQWSHRRLAEVPLTAVSVHEEGTCPAGEEPLHWLLLTSFPVHSFDDAVRVVRAYSFRWVVERVHYTWKSGTCNVEQSQLESFEALTKWAALHLSVAVHRQQILHLSRTQPHLPASEVFDRDQIDAALTLYAGHRSDGPRPGDTPELGPLVEIIARLGGYIGKSSGGPPGIKVLQRGLEHVEIVAMAFRLQRQFQAKPTSDDPFG
jgi:hypothetical protein